MAVQADRLLGKLDVLEDAVVRDIRRVTNG